MSSQENALSPSTSANPDLDWSQIRETVAMLNLAVAQIAGTLTEGDDSVRTLVDSFTSMAGSIEVTSLAASQLNDSPEKETIINNCDSVSSQMQKAIIAFQFYDKMSQRLEHVSNSLRVLGELVSDQQQLYNPYAWRGLQEKIKSKYTVEAERLMFDAVVSGKSVDEAMQIVKQIQEAEQDDDVELF